MLRGRSCSSSGVATWSSLQQVCCTGMAVHGLYGDLSCDSACSRHLLEQIAGGAASYCLLRVTR